MQKKLTQLLCLLCLISGVAQAEDYLDYGLYWFGKDQASEKYTGADNSYYDDTKPTMIYVHGWLYGSSEDDYWRPTFSWSHNAESYDDLQGLDVDEAAAWIDAGWNVGIYYWNQFADELSVFDAEAKIWTTSGLQGMRYRQSDGSYNTVQSPSESISELMTATIAEALANNSNGYLLLHGHSLGNQLAIATAYSLTKLAEQGSIDASLIPERVVLSDPYWSNFIQIYLDGATTGEISTEYVSYLIDHYDLAVEMDRSSGLCDLGLGDCNDDMTEIVAFQRLRPWYTSDLGAKHTMADDWWTLTKTYDAPEEVDAELNETGAVTVSASTSDARIKEMMGSAYEWDQVTGRDTLAPDDDQFQIVDLSD